MKEIRNFTSWALLTSSLLLMLAVTTPVAAAAEEETHLFNATLSLTGDCSVASVDPVADPGCPGGPHPPQSFRRPRGIAVDRFGNRYISSSTPHSPADLGWIDVFDSAGNFITEVVDPVGPQSIAVDSKGNLYVIEYEQGVGGRLSRFAPLLYHPAQGEIEYGTATVVAEYPVVAANSGLAINPDNDHLFVGVEAISEFSSAEEGNDLLTSSIGKGEVDGVEQLAIDAAHAKIYAATCLETAPPGSQPPCIRPGIKSFALNDPDHPVIGEIDGATTPLGLFQSDPHFGLSVAVDEASGHVFVGDIEKAHRVYEFEPDGAYVSTIARGSMPAIIGGAIGVDNGPPSATRGFLFVPVSEAAPGRSLAFEPIAVASPPEIQSVSASGVTTDEAIVKANVKSPGEGGSYRIELTSFADTGFGAAVIIGQGTIPASSEGIAVSAVAAGLAPGTVYRYRAVVENVSGNGGKEGIFRTFTENPFSPGCSNEETRIGLSALLPDCRAYELVTPSNTNGRTPKASGFFGAEFRGHRTPADGAKLTFVVTDGTIPGYEGAGSLSGDPYLASRGAGGWTTTASGPTGLESTAVLPGGTSEDQEYSFWSTSNGEGTAAEGPRTAYVRYPDGHSELLGRGSLGTDPQATGKYISPDGGHIIFASEKHLEEGAAPEGLTSIYDRTADGVTHVVSLLPGDVAAPSRTDLAVPSLDGGSVAFRVGGSVYLRVDNQVTYVVTGEGKFAGISDDGSRVFYLRNGDLYAFDAPGGQVTAFTSVGDAVPINISSDGSAAYFVSPTALPLAPNPEGAEPLAGGNNLYLSREGAPQFVGTLNDLDVEGEFGVNAQIHGLGLWMEVVAEGTLAHDPSRSNPSGDVLLFESTAKLTGYDPEGHREIYRFDAGEGTLTCLSCAPTLAKAAGTASLQEILEAFAGAAPAGDQLANRNLSGDGKRAFFESTEQLVLSDTDGLRDVYEWEAEGVGSCETPEGCIYLISSGKSAEDEYLFEVSENGDDVFVSTSDLLLPLLDPDETPSVYDARVGGGFPPPAARTGECLGEACQPVALPPENPPLASSVFHGVGNVLPTKSRKCGRKAKVAPRSGGKRCGKKKRGSGKPGGHRRAGHGQNGQRKVGGSK